MLVVPVSQPLQMAPSRVCGPLSGLCGFAIALVSGLFSSADATSVLSRALMASVCCVVLGYIAGAVFEFVAVRVIERERDRSGIAELSPTGGEKTHTAKA